jgi:peptidoglycan/xylan/chitin deacetylase (PgdA/CDA1 family)
MNAHGICQKYNAKATFFIAGNNIGKGHINDPGLPWRAVIQVRMSNIVNCNSNRMLKSLQRMAAEGHQVASHTWSHQNFSDVTATQARNQVLWNEIALNDILGYIPTYLRSVSLASNEGGQYLQVIVSYSFHY